MMVFHILLHLNTFLNGWHSILNSTTFYLPVLISPSKVNCELFVQGLGYSRTLSNFEHATGVKQKISARGSKTKSQLGHWPPRAGQKRQTRNLSLQSGVEDWLPLNRWLQPTWNNKLLHIRPPALLRQRYDRTALRDSPVTGPAALVVLLSRFVHLHARRFLS